MKKGFHKNFLERPLNVASACSVDWLSSAQALELELCATNTHFIELFQLFGLLCSYAIRHIFISLSQRVVSNALKITQ